MKWAATPSNAPIPIAHHAAIFGSGNASVTISGRSPKLTTYGSTDRGVLLRPRLYAHAEAMNTACTSVAARPSGMVNATAAAAQQNAAVRTAAALIQPTATGLSPRPTARSLAASNQSLDKPTEA